MIRHNFIKFIGTALLLASVGLFNSTDTQAQSYPGNSWPIATPESQGMSTARLRAVPAGKIDDAVVIRNGFEVWNWGNVSNDRGSWSSVTRSYLVTAWGMAIKDGSVPGGLAVLDRPVRNLNTETARDYASDVLLKHLLSYTSCTNPPGSGWRYSCGQDWFDQYKIFQEVTGKSVHDYLNQKLFSKLGGNPGLEAKPDDSDPRGETNRIDASPRDQARWGYFWLKGGNWNGQQLVDPAIVQKTLTPGPNPNEGWQIHLYRTSSAEFPVPGCPTDLFMAAGGTDRAFVIVSPSLNLVVARWTAGHGNPPREWMGQICQAVTSGITPPPGPIPPPPGPIPPPPPGSGDDDIDLSDAVILSSPADVASWPITTSLGVGLTASDTTVAFSKRTGTNRWPDQTDDPEYAPDPIQYTIWLFVNIDGRWYGSGLIQRYYDQNSVGGPVTDAPCNWYYDAGRWAPMTGHRIVPGERVAFMVTAGDARSPILFTNVRERSNVKLMTVPNIPTPPCSGTPPPPPPPEPPFGAPPGLDCSVPPEDLEELEEWVFWCSIINPLPPVNPPGGTTPPNPQIIGTTNLGGGVFPDVTWFEGRLWIAVKENRGQVTLYSANQDLSGLAVQKTFTFSDADNSFPRLTAHDNTLWLAFRNGLDILLWRQDNNTTENLGRGIGNDPVALGHGFIAWQASADFKVKRRLLTGGPSVDLGSTLPTGINRVNADGSVVMVDQTIYDPQYSVPWGTRPFVAGNLTVAEGPNGGVSGRFNGYAGSEFTLFGTEESFTPHAGASGTGFYAVATWGRPGVRVAVIKGFDCSSPPEDPDDLEDWVFWCGLSGPPPPPPPPPSNNLPSPNHAISFGYYHVLAQYGEFLDEVSDYTNTQIILQESFLRSGLNNITGFNSAFQQAIAAGDDIVYGVSTDWDRGLTAAQPFWNSIDLIYLADEPSWNKQQAEEQITNFKAAVTGKGLAQKQIAINFTRNQILNNTGWQASNLDVVGLEAYVDVSQQNNNVVNAVNQVIDEQKTRIGNKRMFIVMQAYDRNGSWNNLDSLRQIQVPVYLKSYNDPNVVGIFMFSYARSGGTRQHAFLKTEHRKIGQAILGGLPPGIDCSNPPEDPAQLEEWILWCSTNPPPPPPPPGPGPSNPEVFPVDGVAGVAAAYATNTDSMLVVAGYGVADNDRRIVGMMADPKSLALRGSPFRIDMSGTTGSPQVVYSEEAQKFLIAWEDWRCGERCRATYGRFVSAEGIPLDTDFAINIGSAFLSDIDYDPVNDRFVVNYEGDNIIYVRTVALNGTVSQPTVVVESFPYQGQSGVAVNTNKNEYWFVYGTVYTNEGADTAREDDRIFFSRVDAATMRVVGQPVQLSQTRLGRLAQQSGHIAYSTQGGGAMAMWLEREKEGPGTVGMWGRTIYDDLTMSEEYPIITPAILPGSAGYASKSIHYNPWTDTFFVASGDWDGNAWITEIDLNGFVYASELALSVSVASRPSFWSRLLAIKHALAVAIGSFNVSMGVTPYGSATFASQNYQRLVGSVYLSYNASGPISNPPGPGPTSSTPPDTSDIAKLVVRVYSYALGAGALLALLMMILGGYKVTTAGGNAKQSSDGKAMVMSAVVGLGLLLGAYIILNTINSDLVQF